ncbi:MAG: universal stress protein [Thaumarchaeota archaeon]|nr:universal stress protein [Nitrososphaerota archaeon]
MQTQGQAPSPVASQNYRRILVGYDGSENSERALARAAALAAEHGASLSVIVVVNTVVMSIGPMASPIPEEVFDERIDYGKKTLSKAMKTVETSVPSVTGAVEEGYPAEWILNIAARDKVDLIVLGRRGISAVERFLLGGVSSNVVAHSKCDVLIVK